MDNPTLEQWTSYQLAYDYFNASLFGGKLPRCILNFSRNANSNGFFAASRWHQGENKTHEISLNPDVLSDPNRTMCSTMATLVHEICHLADFEQGTSPSTGYHAKSWGRIMESVGLIPSKTGAPGGKKTGFQMTHYIEPNGAFEKAFHAMPNEYLIPWQARGNKSEARKVSPKIKFSVMF